MYPEFLHSVLQDIFFNSICINNAIPKRIQFHSVPYSRIPEFTLEISEEKRIDPKVRMKIKKKNRYFFFSMLPSVFFFNN